MNIITNDKEKFTPPKLKSGDVPVSFRLWTKQELVEVLSKFTKPSLEVAADAKALRPHSRIFSVAIEEEKSHFKKWIAMQQPSVSWGRHGSTLSYPIQEYTGHTQIGSITVAFTTDGERNLVDIATGEPLFSNSRNQDIVKSIVQLSSQSLATHTSYPQAAAITKSGSVWMIRHSHSGGKFHIRKVVSGKFLKGVTQAILHEHTMVLVTKSDVKLVTIPANFFTARNKSAGESTDKIQRDEKVKISQLHKGKTLAVEMSCWRGLPTIYFMIDSKGTLLSGAPNAPDEDTENKSHKTKLTRVKGLLGRACNQEAPATEFLPCMVGNGSPIRSVTACGEHVFCVTEAGDLFGATLTCLPVAYRDACCDALCTVGWGSAKDGQLGVFSQTQIEVPRLLLGGHAVVKCFGSVHGATMVQTADGRCLLFDCDCY